ncbi:acyltransferase [Catenulispora subtropica]|uniref:Acyltransferase n=1 Tax=Catenulispora subtropica TaxID=450798 RepID=A0ABN2TD23_9ACTN
MTTAEAVAIPPRRTGRLAVLDGCRFVAAMMVVSYHLIGINSVAWTDQTSKIFPTVHFVAQYGWLGVELFFLISGFVICMSAWGRGLAEFVVSRVVRLYPAYWVAIVLTMAVLFIWPNPDVPRPNLTDAAINLTMLQSGLGVRSVDAAYWSLWCELQFYALFAVVVWRGLTYRRAIVFCLAWTAASTAALATQNASVEALLSPDYASFFIGGIAFYLIRRFGPNLILWGLVAGSFLLGLRPTVGITTGSAQRLVGQPIPVWGTVFTLAIFYLLMAAIALGYLDRVHWRGLTVLGAMTYPLYLLHEFIGWSWLARMHHLPHWAALSLTVGMLLAISWLIHRFVERPGSPVLKRALTDALKQIRTNGAALPKPRESQEILDLPGEPRPATVGD